MGLKRAGDVSRFDAIKNRVKAQKDTFKRNHIDDHVIGETARGIKQAFKEKGFANKMKAVGKGFGRGVKGRWRNSNLKQMVDKIKQTAIKVAKFIMKFKWVISIGTAVATIIIAVVPPVLGIVSAIKATPHYYCDITAPDEVKQSKVYQQYCSHLMGGLGNDSIAAAAVALATCDESNPSTPRIPYTTLGLSDVRQFANVQGYTVDTFLSVVPKLLAALQIHQDTPNPFGTSQTWVWDAENTLHASCDWSVCLAVLWSGADDFYPTCLGGYEVFDTTPTAFNQTGYLIRGNSGRWVELTHGEPIEPGDVCIGGISSNHGGIGHTWIYLAHWNSTDGWQDSQIVQAKYPGSHANRYEGSHNNYYARLKQVTVSPWEDTQQGVPNRIFRCVSETNIESPFFNITP
jgi:hypothetical protein